MDGSFMRHLSEWAPTSAAIYSVRSSEKPWEERYSRVIGTPAAAWDISPWVADCARPTSWKMVAIIRSSYRRPVLSSVRSYRRFAQPSTRFVCSNRL